MKKLDLKLVTNLTFGGISLEDYPRCCDAYIESADYDGKEATDEQLDQMNDDGDFVHQELHNFLH